MAKYVNLVSNPGRKRRRGRRRRRNPLGTGTLTRHIPSVEEAIGGALGGVSATALPAVLNSTGWMNVLWSAVGGIGAGFLLSMLGRGTGAISKMSAPAALVGGVITFLKASHILTSGSFGLAPETRLTTFIGNGGGGGAAARMLPAPAVASTMAPTTVSSRPGVNAFRESEFRSSAQGAGGDTLLT